MEGGIVGRVRIVGRKEEDRVYGRYGTKVRGTSNSHIIPPFLLS